MTKEASSELPEEDELGLEWPCVDGCGGSVLAAASAASGAKDTVPPLRQKRRHSSCSVSAMSCLSRVYRSGMRSACPPDHPP
eukprot:6460203-Amphidinium_carterae.3